jgi:CubicO group peptidase (beta-lactamase class C family)
VKLSAIQEAYMRRREFLSRSSRAAAGLCLVLPPKRAQDAAWRAAVAELENELPVLMKRDAIPGASAALVRNAALVWRRGFGVADAISKTPVDPDTIFSAGSMSKPVFAYAVMQLCDRRVLDLDVPLTKYTPERYVQGDPRLDLITARHVLSHTSGFQNWRSANEPLRIHFTPGERFLYSGEGYSYLQSVVTRLTGHVDRRICSRYEGGLEVCATDIEPYMKAHLFAPFRMTSAGYVWNPGLESRLARPHAVDGEPLQRIRPSVTDAARYASSGALLATPTDYANCLIEAIAPSGSGPFRLRKATVAEMLRPQVKTNDEFSSSWALGWQIQQTGVINDGGDNTGFLSHALASIENRSGFVIMTNGERGGQLIVKLLMSELMQRLL